MTVIVWDGTTLAADRQGVATEMRSIRTKIYRNDEREIVYGYTGDLARGLIVIDWYLKGADPNQFPKHQEGIDDSWGRLIVADKNGCRCYEDSPFPLPVEQQYMAWGSGRDYAMGALAMGADARKAVEIASKFCITCGLGVDAFDL